jgi:hypothetical protein
MTQCLFKYIHRRKADGMWHRWQTLILLTVAGRKQWLYDMWRGGYPMYEPAAVPQPGGETPLLPWVAGFCMWLRNGGSVAGDVEGGGVCDNDSWHLWRAIPAALNMPGGEPAEGTALPALACCGICVSVWRRNSNNGEITGVAWRNIKHAQALLLHGVIWGQRAWRQL